MSEISNKSRIEFRCRPIRSSSCSDNSNTNITAKALNTATVKNNRKIVLNVPKKIQALTLTQKSKLNLPLHNPISNHTNFSQTYNKYNDSHKHNYNHKQDWHNTSKQFMINIDKQQDNSQLKLGKLSQIDYQNQNQYLQQYQCTNFNQSQHGHQQQQQQQGEEEEEEQQKDDHQSKATMKNNQNNINNGNGNGNRLKIKQRSQSINESKQIKSMLMELADGHQQMMAMLKCIMKKQGYNQNAGQPKPKNQNNRLTLKNSPATDSNHNKKLSYSQVFNQTIYSNQYPNQTQTQPQSSPLSLPFPFSASTSTPTPMQSSTNTTRSKFIHPYIANILVEVLSQKVPYNHLNNTNSMILAQMEIRELISRRFQAFGLKYQFVMETVMQYICNQEKKNNQKFALNKNSLDLGSNLGFGLSLGLGLNEQNLKNKKDKNYNKRSIPKSVIKTMLLQWPYLLTEQQTQIVYRCISNTNTNTNINKSFGLTLTSAQNNSSHLHPHSHSHSHSHPHPQSQSVSISQFCYKLCCFYYQRNKLSQQSTLLRLKISRLKSLIVNKSFELQQLLMNSSSQSSSDGSSEYIQLPSLQKILKQSKFEQSQIQLLTAGLCITARSIAQIQWRMIIDERWADKLLEQYPKTTHTFLVNNNNNNSKNKPEDDTNLNLNLNLNANPKINGNERSNRKSRNIDFDMNANKIINTNKDLNRNTNRDMNVDVDVGINVSKSIKSISNLQLFKIQSVEQSTNAKIRRSQQQIK